VRTASCVATVGDTMDFILAPELLLRGLMALFVGFFIILIILTAGE